MRALALFVAAAGLAPALGADPPKPAAGAAVVFNDARALTDIDPPKAIAEWQRFLRTWPTDARVPYARLNLGLCLYHAKKYPEAAAEAERAAAAPDFGPRPKALLLVGKARRELGRSDPKSPELAAAAAAFRRAAEEGAKPAEPGGPPRDPETAADAGYHAAEVLALQDKWAEADAATKAWLAAHGAARLAADAGFLRASAAYQAGRFADAADHFGTFLDRHPKHARAADARFYRGLALARTPGKEEAAAADLTATANGSGPQQAWAWYELGLLREKQKRADDAVAAFREAANVPDPNPYAAEALSRVAALRQKKDPAAAVEALKQALGRKPAPALDERIRYQLAFIHAGRKDDAAAAAAVDGLLEVHPKGELRFDAALVGAGCRERLKDWAKAEAMWAIVLGSLRKDYRAAARLGLGDAALQLGRPAAAAEHYLALGTDFPDSDLVPRAYLRAGAARQREKKADEARGLFQKAEAGKDAAATAEARFRLAELLLDEKKTAAAAEQFVKAAAVGAADWAPVALVRAGEAYEEIGEPGPAKNCYRKVLREWKASPQAKLAQERLTALGE